MEKVKIRLRLGSHDAHYAGNLVDGAKILQLFGHVGTELLIRHDGDEGLFRAYDSIEFLSPVHSGDYIEAVGWIAEKGNTSRKIKFEAHKVITLMNPKEKGYIAESSAKVLDEPILVCKASGTCVALKELQRNNSRK